MVVRVSTCLWFLKYPGHARFDLWKHPWTLRAPRGGGRFARSPCLLLWRGLRLCRSASDAVVEPQSAELPATTEGKWRRRHSSRGHKAGPLVVLELPSTTYCCRVAFQCVRCEMCNRTAVTTGVTGPNREGASLGGYDNRGVSRRERVLFPFWALRQVALKASELVAAQASSTGSRDPGAAQPVPEAVTQGTPQRGQKLQGKQSGSTTQDRRAPPARTTNPRTGGRLTPRPPGTNPRTGIFVRYPLLLLFNPCQCLRAGLTADLHGVGCLGWLLGRSTACRRSWTLNSIALLSCASTCQGSWVSSVVLSRRAAARSELRCP